MTGIVIGNDSKSIVAKKTVIDALTYLSLTTNDVGTNELVPVDYPDIAMRAMENVLKGISTYAILISQNGNEMVLSCAKTKGIRAVVCRDSEDAEYSRHVLNANVFCIRNKDCKSKESLIEVINTIVTSEFDEGVHARRLEMIGQG